VTFHFFDDVFRENFALESTERILYGFALLQSNFCHAHLPHTIPQRGFVIAERFCSPFGCQALPTASSKPELLPDAVREGGIHPSDYVPCAKFE
jgi:hypothetical protein